MLLKRGILQKIQIFILCFGCMEVPELSAVVLEPVTILLSELYAYYIDLN